MEPAACPALGPRHTHTHTWLCLCSQRSLRAVLKVAGPTLKQTQLCVCSSMAARARARPLCLVQAQGRGVVGPLVQTLGLILAPAATRTQRRSLQSPPPYTWSVTSHDLMALHLASLALSLSCVHVCVCVCVCACACACACARVRVRLQA